MRVELLALYDEVDALLAGWTCSCTTGGAATCCRFDVTGLEPYPTAVELEEVRRGLQAIGIASALKRRRLTLSVERAPCPLLSGGGRCRIYAHRPLGCRTFFCPEAEGPFGARSKFLRAQINEIGRRVASLSAKFDPRDPHARPLVRALEKL